MGYAERSGQGRWAWLHRQPLVRRLVLALKWFRPGHRRRMFRGGFWRWLRGRGCAPEWMVIKADHRMIKQAKREAGE